MSGEIDKEMEKVLKWAKRYDSHVALHKTNLAYCHVVKQPGLEHFISAEKVHRLEDMGYLEAVDGNGAKKAWELTEKGHALAAEILEKSEDDLGPF